MMVRAIFFQFAQRHCSGLVLEYNGKTNDSHSGESTQGNKITVVSNKSHETNNKQRANK